MLGSYPLLNGNSVRRLRPLPHLISGLTSRPLEQRVSFGVTQIEQLIVSTHDMNAHQERDRSDLCRTIQRSEIGFVERFSRLNGN